MKLVAALFVWGRTFFGGLPSAIHSALHYPRNPAPANGGGGVVFRATLPSELGTLRKKQNPGAKLRGFLLPDLDSNQDKLNQNQLYYHYTIGQPWSLLKGSAKVRASILFPK